MQLHTAPPLLVALGLRIFLNYMNPAHTDGTPDHILHGLWQGVLLYHTLKHIQLLVFPAGFGITAKLTLDYVNTNDTTQCACTLLGVVLGVLFTEVLAQVFEHGHYFERAAAPASAPSPTHAREPSSRRLRLVSFEKGSSRKARADAERARALASSPAPTQAHSIDTALTLESIPSSIDPEGRLTPREKEVAILRARASLADSERRRFKEERKWAMSQGNTARAEQLAWQVRRFTTLMDSFHKEADAKVVEGECRRRLATIGTM